MKTITFCLLWMLSSASLFSQTKLQGNITDGKTGEPIIYGTVALYKNDVLITGTESDLNGYYSLTELNPGIYEVIFSYTGYQDFKVTEVIIQADRATQLNAKLTAPVNPVIICTGCFFRSPVSIDETTQGFKFNAEEIRRLAF